MARCYITDGVSVAFIRHVFDRMLFSSQTSVYSVLHLIDIIQLDPSFAEAEEILSYP